MQQNVGIKMIGNISAGLYFHFTFLKKSLEMADFVKIQIVYNLEFSIKKVLLEVQFRLILCSANEEVDVLAKRGAAQ